MVLKVERGSHKQYFSLISPNIFFCRVCRSEAKPLNANGSLPEIGKRNSGSLIPPRPSVFLHGCLLFSRRYHGIIARDISFQVVNCRRLRRDEPVYHVVSPALSKNSSVVIPITIPFLQLPLRAKSARRIHFATSSHRRYVLVVFDDRPAGLLSHADGSGLFPEARPMLTALSWEEIRLALMLDISSN